LDFGTNATMEQMGELFAREHIHATISPGGESVGTLDPVFNNTIGYEVTSLQQESTESSHIKYTSPWEEDAHRRDFTVNTMSLGMDGVVYDYMGGRQDLKDGMVKFVGDVEQSIQEDHLRQLIFRYFRFYGRISGGPNDHCEYVLDTVRRNVAGIGGLPGPRIWVNWAGILNGNLAGEVMKTMLDVGMGPFMGLPERPDVEELDGVWLRTRDLGDRLNPVTLAVALLSDLGQVHTLADRLEWSDRERNLGVFIVTHRNLTHLDESDRLPAYRMITVTSLTPDQDIKDFMTQLMFYLGDKDLTEEIPTWMTSRKTRSSFLKLYMDYMSTQSDIQNVGR